MKKPAPACILKGVPGRPGTPAGASKTHGISPAPSEMQAGAQLSILDVQGGVNCSGGRPGGPTLKNLLPTAFREGFEAGRGRWREPADPLAPLSMLLTSLLPCLPARRAKGSEVVKGAGGRAGGLT